MISIESYTLSSRNSMIWVVEYNTNVEPKDQYKLLFWITVDGKCGPPLEYHRKIVRESNGVLFTYPWKRIA
jgi:hypothetical protein